MWSWSAAFCDVPVVQLVPLPASARSHAFRVSVYIMCAVGPPPVVGHACELCPFGRSSRWTRKLVGARGKNDAKAVLRRGRGELEDEAAPMDVVDISFTAPPLSDSPRDERFCRQIGYLWRFSRSFKRSSRHSFFCYSHTILSHVYAFPVLTRCLNAKKTATKLSASISVFKISYSIPNLLLAPLWVVMWPSLVSSSLCTVVALLSNYYMSCGDDVNRYRYRGPASALRRYQHPRITAAIVALLFSWLCARVNAETSVLLSNIFFCTYNGSLKLF